MQSSLSHNPAGLSYVAMSTLADLRMTEQHGLADHRLDLQVHACRTALDGLEAHVDRLQLM